MTAKSKRFLPNMNTTTITKHPFAFVAFRTPSKRVAINKAKQVERKSSSVFGLSRSPSVKNNIHNSRAASTTSYKTSFNSNISMKTLNLRKLLFVALGLTGVVATAATLISTEGLILVGEVVGFGAALAILALAATDNTRTKRLA